MLFRNARMECAWIEIKNEREVCVQQNLTTFSFLFYNSIIRREVI